MRTFLWTMIALYAVAGILTAWRIATASYPRTITVKNCWTDIATYCVQAVMMFWASAILARLP